MGTAGGVNPGKDEPLVLSLRERGQLREALAHAFRTPARITDVLDAIEFPMDHRDVVVDGSPANVIWNGLFHELDAGALDDGYRRMLTYVYGVYSGNAVFRRLYLAHASGDGFHTDDVVAGDVGRVQQPAAARTPGAPSPTSEDVKRLERHVIERGFGKSVIGGVLDEIGLPDRDVNFDQAIAAVWTDVFRLLRWGRVERGHLKLAQALHDRFPDDQFLRAFLGD